MPGMNVGINIVGTDNASAAFAKAARGAETSSSKMKAAFGSAIATAGKLGVALGAYELVKKALDIGREAAAFQKQMTQVQTQAGATATEVAYMSKGLLAMAGDVATAPEQLATSLYHVYSVGLSAAKSLEVVRIAAMGAKIGNADLEETTNALTATVASGISGVKNMGQAMGALNTIVGSGDMKLSDLNDALAGGILTAAKIFGVNLTQVGAALAVFGDNNIRGAEAATQLRMALLGLAHAPGAGEHALASIGLTSQRLTKDLAHGGLTSALDDLTGHMKDAGITGKRVGGFILSAFGRKAGVGLGILVDQAQRFHIKLDEIGKGAHGFGDAWAATTHTASFAFKRLGVEANVAGMRIALGVMPKLTEVASAIGDVLPAAVRKAGQILTPFGQVLGTAFAGAWTVLGGAATAAGVILSGLGSILNTLKTPLTVIGTLVLSVWAGFKGAAIIGSIMETVALKMMYARDAMVGFGVSAKASALSFIGSSTAIAGSADATATSVAASGRVAGVGWAGVLGPIAGIGIGIALLVSMFHKSAGASKEAAAAAKAYTDALKTGNKSELVDAITGQLRGSKLPETLAVINRGLATTAITGKQFVTAIQSGGKPLENLRTRLQDVIKAGTSLRPMGRGMVQVFTPAAQAAAKALVVLNTQLGGMSKATRKELLNTRAFAGVASTIDKVSQSTHIASDTAKTYAEMLGIQVSKNGVAAVSSTTLAAAVNKVQFAYSHATTAGSEFLSALSTFSKSGGTAADRAALIGATLKAANGDMLGFAGAMNAGSAASRTFSSDIRSSAKTAKVSTGAYLASIVNLKTGTIDYTKQGAGPLITNLQSMQTAAMAAAQATFQHAKATMSGKRAADEAYKVYNSMTRGALVDQFTKLTGNAKAAQRLADKYFGMPKNVKTLIRQEGGDPILGVLNRIGQLLANLTGQPWHFNVIGEMSQAQSDLSHLFDSIPKGTFHFNVVEDRTRHDQGIGNPAPRVNPSSLTHATGGFIAGPGSGTSDSIPAWLSNGEFVVNAKQTARHRGLLHAINSGIQGYASGGLVGQAKLNHDSGVVGMMTSFVGAVTHLSATYAEIRDAGKALYSAAKASKASASELRLLAKDERHLNNLALERDRVNARLGSAPTAPTAYDRLASAKSAYSDVRSSVRGAVGAFDVTQAGVSQQVYTDKPAAPVSAGSILAELTKTAAKAARFAGLLRKLAKNGLPKPLLLQLAQAGPAAMEQANALAVATPAQIAALSGQYRSLAASGSYAGTLMANDLKGAGVRSAQGLVNGLLSQRSRLNRAIKSLGESMVHQLKHTLGIKSPSTVTHSIGVNLGRGLEIGMASRAPHVEAQANRMAHKAIPNPSSGGGGQTVIVHQTINPAPGMDEVAVGAVAARRLAALVY